MNDTLVLIVLFAASFAFIMIEVVRWQDYYDHFYAHKPFDRKPFNCIPCLSGWTGFALSLILGEWCASILLLPICMVAGIALEGLLKRL